MKVRMNNASHDFCQPRRQIALHLEPRDQAGQGMCDATIRTEPAAGEQKLPDHEYHNPATCVTHGEEAEEFNLPSGVTGAYLMHDEDK